MAKLFDGEGVVQGIISDARTAKSGEVGARAERFAHVAHERANVGAFRAYYFEIYFRHADVNVKFADFNFTRGQLRLFSFTRQHVRTFSVDFHGRVHRG